MGPSLDLELRRSRQPPPDLEKEACRQPKLDKKKVGLRLLASAQSGAIQRSAWRQQAACSRRVAYAAWRVGASAHPPGDAHQRQGLHADGGAPARLCCCGWNRGFCFRLPRRTPPSATSPPPRRSRPPPVQQKNVGSDVLEGKVGRIYMPKQEVEKMALAKPKGVKRERRAAAAEAAAAKKQRTADGAAGGSSGGDD